ncbi:peptidoglycan DD-metalloendopeptidase family protein [Pseudacidovorax sp. RU35E]|uniref:peptidoglycan DD-metalloendopeptidase family protein n=1 Tax=Pseudacidovorax sp. RU35E TaxID=1907403 RepID=UPI000954E714|nr:peptidoglycan DD-metalloendopeptidase family protein [Pseudacidovorax sp. RU35E]SIR07221.1 lipoprotein NlpD [Pseudacidovorax sp. RU35E]
MQGSGRWHTLAWMGAAAACVVLAGCASSRGPAPVEDRAPVGMAGTTTASSASGLPTTDASGKPLPGIENLGKPGYYAVRPGDTVRRIALDTGQNWRDIVRWNGLDNPDRIEVGQVLRVVPPVAGGVVTPPPAVAGVGTLPPTTTTAPAVPPPVAPPVVAGSTPTPKPAGNPPSASGDDDLGWIWPAQGALIAGFDDAKNKGLDIAGRAGDPVLAAADGKVVYAGAGLRGYGNLIILKHNNTFLTAYAHNQALLVKEDQSVQKGQKIAEMGSSDADRVKLHFEIRRQGKPVDPSRYLPARP